MQTTLYNKEDNKLLEKILNPNLDNKDSVQKETALRMEFDYVPIEVVESKIAEVHKQVLKSGQALSVKLNEIQSITPVDSPLNKDTTVFFNQSKKNKEFSIDNSILSPTPATVLGVIGFEKKYLAQIERLIFNDFDKINPENIFTLVYLVDIFEKKLGPIKIATNRNRRLSDKMVKVLNEFFNKNYNVLKGIYTMFNGLVAEDEKTKE